MKTGNPHASFTEKKVWALVLRGLVFAFALGVLATPLHAVRPAGENTQTTPGASFVQKIKNWFQAPHWGRPEGDGPEIIPLSKLKGPQQDAQIRSDLQAVRLYREGLFRVLKNVQAHPELFPTKPTEERMLNGQAREQVRNTWQSFLDYYLALDALAKYHQDFLHLRGQRRADSFLVLYAAFMAEYRAALEFLAVAQNDPGLDKILNEPLPELGLAENSYADFKFRFLNVARAMELAEMDTIIRTGNTRNYTDIRTAAGQDSHTLWAMGKGKGEMMTLKNALTMMRRGAHQAWFPVQASVADLMGDVKVYRWGRSLIGRDQVQKVLPQLDPGDILLERREWHLSNVGLPGFWTHAAIYIGTPRERADYFNESETKAWLNAQGHDDIESMLAASYPNAYEASQAPQEEGHAPRVIEAVGEGVIFTSLEHSAGCDSLAVLRPRLSKKEKAMAILNAFKYSGRPYDFDFDFMTDSALVCTELVYKSFEPGSGQRGLKLKLTELLDRKLIPANEIAHQFDESYGTPDPQLDFVLFMDGHEREGRAVEAGLASFRTSWRWPKWHVLTQGTRWEVKAASRP